MKPDNARILVVGAGVNGSVCASVLHNGGIDVTVLARGKRYEEVRSDGIIIENPFNKKRTITRVRVIDSLDSNDLYDYILVVVRKNQIAELLPLLARNKSPNVVFMGNTLTGAFEYTQHLRTYRVMFGFVYAGGKRDGNVIRAMVIKSIAVPFGEIDGTITPRLRRLVGILRQAGLKAKASRCIIDALLTHAVGVPLIGIPTIAFEYNIRALARSRTDLRLIVDAMRESFDVLQALGYQIIPKITSLIKILPRFVWVAILRILFSSRFGEVGAAYHISQAPDEMRHLAKELQVLVERSGLPTPAIRKLLSMKS